MNELFEENNDGQLDFRTRNIPAFDYAKLILVARAGEVENSYFHHHRSNDIQAIILFLLNPERNPLTHAELMRIEQSSKATALHILHIQAEVPKDEIQRMAELLTP